MQNKHIMSDVLSYTERQQTFHVFSTLKMLKSLPVRRINHSMSVCLTKLVLSALKCPARNDQDEGVLNYPLLIR